MSTPIAPEGRPIRVAPDRSRFLRGSRPFFYLADTAWSAFTNATLEEWAEYLEHRRLQGFTAVQLNILPQWDRSLGAAHPDPFRKGREGAWDYGAPNEEYFQRAVQMCAAAVQRGITPALVVLWCNYVPGTWASRRFPGREIPLEAVEPYCRYVAQTFAPFQPIYLVSGDTDFLAPETTATYLAALRAMKQHAPDSLTTLHLSPDTELPEEVVDAGELDFYMYQSGHHVESQQRSYRLAERFGSKRVLRPVVNGEPCYEGIQYFRAHGRFRAFDVRRAVWQSLLSGASAGVTYGAHGIWCWHRPGLSFGGTDEWNQPYGWREALQFPGAWDAGFARWLFERYGLFELQPQQALLAGDGRGTEEIRAAATADGGKVATYLPYAAELELALDLGGHECRLFDLAERRVLSPRLEHGKGKSKLQLPGVNADLLLVAIRSQAEQGGRG
jgi:hypothetical protein